MADDRTNLRDRMFQLQALTAGLAAVREQRTSYESFEGLKYEEAEVTLLEMLAQQINQIVLGMDDKTARTEL